MRYLFLTLITVFYMGAAAAQETFTKRNRLTDDISEKFQILKKDKSVKQGLYQAVFRKTTAIASGEYVNNKRTGIWHFYNRQSTLIQNFDFSHNKLLFEAPEDSTSDLQYFVDKQLTDKDVTTKPVRPGGAYYGYLPYLIPFKLPNYLQDINRGGSLAVAELLVSPLGRLASCKVTIYSGDYEKTFNMNIDMLNEDDKIFIPATVNKEPISCRILIKCYITSNGIDFF